MTGNVNSEKVVWFLRPGGKPRGEERRKELCDVLGESSHGHPRIRLPPRRGFCSWLLTAILSARLLPPGVALNQHLRTLCLVA